MSRGYAFDIQCGGLGEWFWEWASFNDRSAYWLRLGPFEFAFNAVGKRRDGELVPFTRAVAFEALKRWAWPALAPPLQIAGDAVIVRTPTDTVQTCNFETLIALADQMPRERFEQLRIERPDFGRWLTERHGAVARGLSCLSCSLTLF